MANKQYEELLIEIIALDSQDMITTSTDPGKDDTIDWGLFSE